MCASCVSFAGKHLGDMMVSTVEVISFSFAVSASAFMHILLASTQSFCILSLKVVDCKSISIGASSSEPPATKKYFSEISCRTYGHGAKGFVINEMGMYFPCSKSTCPGVFGCEPCCTEFSTPNTRDPKERQDKLNNNEQGEEEDTDEQQTIIAASPFKDKLFLTLGAILVFVVIVAIVIHVRLFHFLYCSKEDEPQSTEKHTEKSTEKRLKVSFAFGKASSKCDAAPPIKMKLSGRSCKVSPQCLSGLDNQGRKVSEGCSNSSNNSSSFFFNKIYPQ